MELIQVLVIDDHPVVRRGLRRYFELLPDIRLAGEATGGAEALALAPRLRPDVILLDLSMPEMDGLAVARAIQALLPGTPILIFTSACSTEHVLGALRAGASGFLLKGADVDEVGLAIRTAAAGQPYLTPLAARVLISDSLDPAPAARLTGRERAVYELVGRGLSNRAIAAELGMSEKTTSVHLSNLMAKLGLRSRTQVAVHALAAGVAA
jgi:DNA-binding NarL/FixJ family response regulator